jgi:hypothetical protein
MSDMSDKKRLFALLVILFCLVGGFVGLLKEIRQSASTPSPPAPASETTH